MFNVFTKQKLELELEKQKLELEKQNFNREKDFIRKEIELELQLKKSEQEQDWHHQMGVAKEELATKMSEFVKENNKQIIDLVKSIKTNFPNNNVSVVK